MVPLFKSVGYQLKYHTFTESVSISNSNLVNSPYQRFFDASWNRKKTHPPPRICKLQTCLAP